MTSHLAAKLNRLHAHWEDAAKLLERKKWKMEAIHHKLDKIEKKINRRQHQIDLYQFLVDHYPREIEKLKQQAQEEDEEDIPEE